MSELIWLNGEISGLGEARISVEDRGFQFADGVYEFLRIYNGKPFTLMPHLARLEKSAAGILLPMPMPVESLAGEVKKLIGRSELKVGMVYMQLTRGASPRNHLFPAGNGHTLLFYTREIPLAPEPGTGEGVKLMTVADERWKRCWIKSIALLPNILAKNAAAAAGADEAVFVENGQVSECSSANLFVVIGRKLVTHPIGSKVLPGITRAVLLELAGGLGIEIDERAIGEEEARRADEMFITSTTREISWVARWNDKYIGQARCGPLTKKLHLALRERIARETD